MAEEQVEYPREREEFHLSGEWVDLVEGDAVIARLPADRFRRARPGDRLFVLGGRVVVEVERGPEGELRLRMVRFSSP